MTKSAKKLEKNEGVAATLLAQLTLPLAEIHHHRRLQNLPQEAHSAIDLAQALLAVDVLGVLRAVAFGCRVGHALHHARSLDCPCGGRMKYVATIFDRKGLQRLLRAKRLPLLIEPTRPARAPPQADLDFGA